jgi:hypothetical protein
MYSQTNRLPSNIIDNFIFSDLGESWEYYKNGNYINAFDKIYCLSCLKNPKCEYLMGEYCEFGLGEVLKSPKDAAHYYSRAIMNGDNFYFLKVKAEEGLESVINLKKNPENKRENSCVKKSCTEEICVEEEYAEENCIGENCAEESCVGESCVEKSCDGESCVEKSCVGKSCVGESCVEENCVEKSCVEESCFDYMCNFLRRGSVSRYYYTQEKKIN